MITFTENKSSTINTYNNTNNNNNNNNNTTTKKKLLKNILILLFLFSLINLILLKKINFNFKNNQQYHKKYYHNNINNKNDNDNNNDNNDIDSNSFVKKKIIDSFDYSSFSNSNSLIDNNMEGIKKVFWPSVYFKKQGDVLPIEWNKCTLTKLGIDTNSKSIGYAHIELDSENGKLILSPTSQNYDKDIYSYSRDNSYESDVNKIKKKLDQKVIIAHAKSCPFHELEISNSIIHKDLQIEKQLYPPVKVGVGVLVEDSDNQRILITKRAETLRIFPGVWVLPGGHMEQSETIFETGLRELEEEVGIDKSMVDLDSLKVIGIFESSYPILLAHDKLPGDHHIVIFISVKLNNNNGNNNEKSPVNLKLQEEEVQIGAWVSKSLMVKIMDGISTEYDLFNNLKGDNTNNNNNDIKRQTHLKKNKEESIEVVYPINSKNEQEKLRGDQVMDMFFKGTDNIAIGTIYILKQYLNSDD
ncbi:hypothetical protein DICPUDRAFT_97569 [Dictyostelium purpureum]|uniref:m7GpppN-mRNA hydrolase NUDT17 n=1 Tax=Dictyostelium purpureum TaxID=5786 RepID=F0ZHU9_DICPU|nr:uncharacterized protein DICPUDRAFT_97569 [Dictyostelium purpureum]EGC36485.1 hypothetical protein DICPUDRAFT_97569 [Dictyostelium purpureum]|eukprot:XP_003286998.1 hypothetical protein DICPUDRAFT_97569 [Dictyostelium purpureum]